MKLLLTFFLHLTVISGFSQYNSGKIFYKFSHQRDTTSNSIYTEEMQLIFSGTMTMYNSRSKELRDSLLEFQIAKGLEDGMPVKLGQMREVNQQKYYSDITHNTAYVESNFLGKNYLFSDSIRVINWHLENEFKYLDSFKCQKATGDFAGRKYTAWFCKNIPLNAGPWKLCGLPGLVMEAYDSAKQVNFLYDGLAESNVPCVLPQNTIATSRNEFMKMIAAYNENPAAFLHENPDGLSIHVTKKPGNNTTNTFNNPLELIAPATR